MSRHPEGFVRRSTMIVAVIVALVAGAYVGGMSVLLYQSSQSDQAGQFGQDSGGEAGLPPGMPGAMPGGKPQGMPPGMPGGAPGGMPGSMGQTSSDLTPHILELEKDLALSPGKTDQWVELGNLYYDADQPAKSIAAYDKALALGLKNPDVYTDMGVMYRRLGQPEKAIEYFDRAIALDPGHEVAHYNKGVVALHDLNSPETAMKTWEVLLAKKPLAKTPDGRPLADLLAEMKKKAGAGVAAPKP